MDFVKLREQIKAENELSAFLKEHTVEEARLKFATDSAISLLKTRLLHEDIYGVQAVLNSVSNEEVWRLLQDNDFSRESFWRVCKVRKYTGIDEKNQSRIIGVTGHRPNKLYGYDLQDSRWVKLKELFKEILVKEKAVAAVSGMALGTDQIFAAAVLELKDSGYDIKLIAMIPFREYSLKWPEYSQKFYKAILDRADKINFVVSQLEPVNVALQKRNKAIVDVIDRLVCVWDGSVSGTKCCIEYADSQGVELIPINPVKIELY